LQLDPWAADQGGLQVRLQENTMQLSKFNVWVKDYPHLNDWLLFNTRTQALIKINPDFKQKLDLLGSADNDGAGKIPPDSIAALKQSGIIVKDDKEENEKLDDFFRQIKFDSSRLPLEVTILTTYSCNFKCVYCFEESVKDEVFLDKNTSDQIVQWLIIRAQVKRYKRIYLVFYGGEPLLNVKPIYDISWQLQEWAQKKGIEFGFGIITNGSLVNPSLIDKFLSVGLKEIRISIDGFRDEHNKKRPFCDGRPTFDVLINNIKSVIDKVQVGIAGNFDRENFDSIPVLLDCLKEQGLLYKLKGIDFAPLAPRLGPKDDPGAMELGTCMSHISKTGLFQEVLAIKKELSRRGLQYSTGLAINACSLTMEDAGITIDPKGALYKCNALVGYPEFSIGNVWSDEFNRKCSEFLNIDAWNKCAGDCPYVPMCQGGCRFYSYLENKNFTDLSCKKDYFDLITPDLIKLEYEKLHAGA
jgi:uncharacterized protein